MMNPRPHRTAGKDRACLAGSPSARSTARPGYAARSPVAHKTQARNHHAQASLAACLEERYKGADSGAPDAPAALGPGAACAGFLGLQRRPPTCRLWRPNQGRRRGFVALQRRLPTRCLWPSYAGCRRGIRGLLTKAAETAFGGRPIRRPGFIGPAQACHIWGKAAKTTLVA
jgi:hypothetical protein